MTPRTPDALLQQVQEMALLLKAWGELHPMPKFEDPRLHERHFALRCETVRALGGGFQELAGSADEVLDMHRGAARKEQGNGIDG